MSTRMDVGTVVRQAPRTAARVLDEKAVVVVIDQNVLHTLNEVGTRVWELAEGVELAQIIDTIATEYDVGAATARADVESFVLEMLELGILEIETRDDGTVS